MFAAAGVRQTVPPCAPRRGGSNRASRGAIDAPIGELLTSRPRRRDFPAAFFEPEFAHLLFGWM